jgi:hypothetical protein
MNLTVRNVERTWVDVPFREVARRNMIRELPHFSVFEICRVTLECGVTGVGETMCFYTLDEVTDETCGASPLPLSFGGALRDRYLGAAETRARAGPAKPEDPLGARVIPASSSAPRLHLLAPVPPL